MATTPPPPSTLRTPPTPRHGAGYYSYEPYSTRHSARLASQQRSHEYTTPPPRTPPSRVQEGLVTTPKQSRANMGTLSPPGSTGSSPQKKSPSRPRRSLNRGSASNIVASAETTQHDLSHEGITLTAAMLPTPVKTPKKKKVVRDVSCAAKVLFTKTAAEERTKKRRKYNGFHLDSFHKEPNQNRGKIEIFTDSRDKVPKHDESEDNPFCREAGKANTSVDTSSCTTKRRKLDIKRTKEVEEALERDDGMIYVFRGKKTFRKFDDEDEDDESDSNDLGLLAAHPDLVDSSMGTRIRPLTRSSIKPRVLFPTAKPRHAGDAHAGIGGKVLAASS